VLHLQVEGLTRLPKLEFVDLSNNLIEDFDEGTASNCAAVVRLASDLIACASAELPKTLLGVGLAGNPCALSDDTAFDC
jgi:hypothetical protein